MKMTIEKNILFNPAFCGELILKCLNGYRENRQELFPFPLVYLILPLILHKDTRNSIPNSKYALMNWIKNNPQIKIGLSNRAKYLLPITNEVIIFLIHYQSIRLSREGMIEVLVTHEYPKSKPLYTYFNKSLILGRLLSETISVETIFIELGVSP